VDAWRSVLGPADIDRRTVQVDLLPAEIHQLTDPQGVTEGHQDQQPIAARVTALTSSSHQLVDLLLGEVLAAAIVGVLAATTFNCRHFSL